MKKIIFLWGILLPITFSFALTINPTPTNIENAAKNGILHLDNGKNTFNKSNANHTNQIQLDHKKNNFKCSSCTFDNITNPLHITCKNGLITKIQGYANHTPDYILTGNFQRLILNYNYSGHEYKSNITLQCKPIAQPIKQIIENTKDIDYASISQKNSFITYKLTSPAKPDITQDDIKTQFIPGSNPNEQPTFVDVLFLQLATISNLTQNLLLQKPDIDFKNLFKNNSDTGYNFSGYNLWLNKFLAYQTKQEFVNTFSGAITLKDIGIAQDVINGLYKCLNTNNCNQVIKFKHSVSNNYDTYTFNEIETSLYKDTNNIISGSIIYSQNIINNCSGNSITDSFVKTQVEGICNKIKVADPSNLGINYNLGYGLNKRIENLKTIRQNTPGNGINLKGIFNVYWELNNLTIGTTKANIVEKVKNYNGDLTGQLLQLQKIFKLNTDLLSQKIGAEDTDETDYADKILIEQAKLNLISTSPYLNNLKDKNVNLTDENNFEVSNGVVKEKNTGITYPDNSNTINNFDSNITISLSTTYPYTDLTLDNGNEKKFFKQLGYKRKEITSNLYILAPTLLNEWNNPEGYYFETGIKTNLTNCLNTFKNKYVSCASSCNKKRCFKKCYKKYITSYKDCVNNTFNNNNYISIYRSRVNGGYIAKYHDQ